MPSRVASCWGCGKVTRNTRRRSAARSASRVKGRGVDSCGLVVLVRSRVRGRHEPVSMLSDIVTQGFVIRACDCLLEPRIAARLAWFVLKTKYTQMRQRALRRRQPPQRWRICVLAAFLFDSCFSGDKTLVHSTTPAVAVGFFEIRRRHTEGIPRACRGHTRGRTRGPTVFSTFFGLPQGRGPQAGEKILILLKLIIIERDGLELGGSLPRPLANRAKNMEKTVGPRVCPRVCPRYALGMPPARPRSE